MLHFTIHETPVSFLCLAYIQVNKHGQTTEE